MDVSVEFDGRVYRFCSVGNYKTWVNHKNIIVPAVMHADLRKAAIECGVDPDTFIRKSPPKKERAKRKRVSVKKSRKGSVIGGLSIASILKTGEKNGTE